MLTQAGLHERQEDLGALKPHTGSRKGKFLGKLFPQAVVSTAVHSHGNSLFVSQYLWFFPWGGGSQRLKTVVFSSSHLPVFTKCVGALQTSVPLSALVEGGSKSWGMCTHNTIAPASLKLQILQSSH